MPLRVDRPSSVVFEEAEVTLEMENEDSISSEEETGSACDFELNARTRPVLEIWDNNLIWSRLQTLPNTEEILEILNNNLDFEMLSTKNPFSAIFLATWLNKDAALKFLIDSTASLKLLDDSGRSPLHLAAYCGNLECLKVLLRAGADVSAKDTICKATPLHCAASRGHLCCLKLLIRHGADVNAGLTNKSALHYAAQSLALDCVKELLENGAIPNTPQIFSETPLHVAAGLGASEIVQLLISYGAAVNVQYGSEKFTPLHLAAEDGESECARLLIDSGANLHSANHKNQTPLHLAALSQCSETLELLLSKGANPNACDIDGRTPLHCAIVKVSRSCECVRILLTSGADVNQQDSFGYTPLHLAALNEFSNCVMLLLNHGGDVTVRTNGGISVLTFITRKTPDVIPKYIAKFDNSIQLNDHEIGDVDCELKLDFRVLVPTVGNKETELLLNFIEVGHREVLKHPLCETFLFLKWRRIRKFFLFSLIYHSLFVVLFTIYVIGVFLNNYPAELAVEMCKYLLICLNVMLMSKEMFQIFHSWRIYIKQWENWLQWLIIVSCFACIRPDSVNIGKNINYWQHHIAAIGIFLAWVELMMIVGRFPIFGLYIQMFTTVSVNFVKFVAAYVCLLIAFALSFGVLFANYKSFKDLQWVIMKVLVMMSGELEYEDIFYDDESPIIYNGTAQIMFLAYVILVTVILTNLMVGLAVSDIQGLQQSAGLDRLVRQAELVAHLESMLFSRLLKCIPYKLMKFFHKQALLLKSQFHWALYIKPNDPREERIPRDLIRSIYQLVAERKEKPKRSKKRQRDEVTIATLSRVNSDSSRKVEFKEELEELNRDLNEFMRVFKERIERISVRFESKS